MGLDKLLKWYAISWCVVAMISLLNYPALGRGACYFQTNWFRCEPDTPNAYKWIIWVGVVAMSVLCMVVGTRLWRVWQSAGSERVTLSTTLLVGIVVAACCVLPVGSSDTSYYFNAGKAVATGTNVFVENWSMEKPYMYPVPHATLQGFSYGPLMAHYFAFVYKLSGGTMVWFLFVWRVTLLAVFIGLGVLTLRLIRAWQPETRASVFYVFWFTQPLLLFEILVNGHFDIVWLGTVLLAFWAALKNKWWIAVPILAIGTWIKFIPILFAPFFVLWWWQTVTRATWTQHVRSLGIGIALALGVTWLSWYGLWSGTTVFQSVVVQSKWAVMSWFAIIYYSLKPVFEVVWGEHAHWWLTRFTQAALCVVLGYFVWPYIKKFWKVFTRTSVLTPEQYLQSMFVCLMLYLFIWQKSLWPWYLIWFVPLGIIVSRILHDERVYKITMWISVIPLAFYGVWLGNWWLRGMDAGSELWFYYFFIMTTTAYPLYLLWKWRQRDFT